VYHHVTVGREVGGRAGADDPSVGYFFFNDARGPGGKRKRGLSCTVSIASAPSSRVLDLRVGMQPE
jgi:hypothetical protein